MKEREPVVPPMIFGEGDKVTYCHPKHPAYSLCGTVIGSYEDDRLIVVTDGGREWALFTKYLSHTTGETT